MNADDARAAMIKQTRREILAVLNVMYHIGPFSFPAICGGLAHLELPDDQCVQRDLTYLCEKGYVVWTNERAMMPWKDRMYRLTAEGNEMAERIDRDPALEP